MEYFELGDLQKHLMQPLPEPEAQHISYQILEGLEHLHGNGFAHRDLKPANIFVVQKRPKWWVKIGDFGISKRLQDGDTAFRTMVGTETHLAPEVLLNRFGGTQAYTYMVDMWSLGVMTHYVLTRNLPFKTSGELSAYTQNNHFPSSALQSQGVSREGQDFTRSLLAVDPATRLAAKHALEHDWIKIDLQVFSSHAPEGEIADYTPSPLEAPTAAQLEVTSPVSSRRWSDLMQSTLRPHEAEAATLPAAGQGGATTQQQEQGPRTLPAVGQAVAITQPQESVTMTPRPQVPETPASRHLRNPEHRLKLIIVGDAYCGKTSLLMTLTRGTFSEGLVHSIFEKYVAHVEVDGTHAELTLWDTEGSDVYDGARALSYPDSHVVLICFAIDLPDSLDNIQEKWIPEVFHFCYGLPIILVGCKKDLRYDLNANEELQMVSQTPVTAEEGEILRKKMRAYKYLECSARTNEGVLEVFEAATRVALLASTKRKKWWRRILAPHPVK